MRLSVTCKYFVLIAIHFCTAINLLAQHSPAPSEIFIIGTIHTGNKKFNHNTLYNILNRLKPDIILREQDKPYKSVFGLRAANFLKIRKSSIEQLSVQQYAKRNKNAVILPYDTLIPNRRGYVKKWIAINNRFYRQLDAASLSTQDSIVYASFKKTNKEYYSWVLGSTLSAINHPDVMERTRQLYEIEKGQVLNMGKLYLTDTAIVNGFENTTIFWDKRNAYMVEQLVKIINENPGKKILILCGLNHKYYLTERLGKQNVLITNSYTLLGKPE